MKAWKFMKILNAHLHELRLFCSGFVILFWKYVKSGAKVGRGGGG